MQARLETNSSNYKPNSAQSAISMATSDNSFQVEDNNYAIAGYLSDANLGDGQHYNMIFRAVFNPSYSSFSANPNALQEITINNKTWMLPKIDYVSMNNLNRQKIPANSYDSSGNVYHTVAGGSCEVIVDGFVLSPNGGGYLARRTVQAMLKTSGVGSNNIGAASAAKDLNLTLLKSGGAVSVSSTDEGGNASIASLRGNITIFGKDPVSSLNAMPGYTSSGSAYLSTAPIPLKRFTDPRPGNTP